MASKRNALPVIIRRCNTVAEETHHGGAWKVAYADFVTALMAFFLLMWLLNATTEKQRQGLAEYFAPTIIHVPASAAMGLDGGESDDPPADQSAAYAPSADRQMREIEQAIQNALTGTGAESMQRVNLLRHVVTRITDEGLVIELGDIVDEALFHGESAEPTPALRELTAILATVLGRTKNQLAIAGHVRGFPEMLVENPTWPLSDQRAHAVRLLLAEGRLDERRIQRVTAYGDRKPRNSNVMDPGNNRIEVILLR